MSSGQAGESIVRRTSARSREPMAFRPWHGKPTVCVAGHDGRACIAPYVDQSMSTAEDHTARPRSTDIDGGRMNGSSRTCRPGREAARIRPNPACARTGGRDGISHQERHTELLDRRKGLRAPGPYVRAHASWNLPAHLFLVSEWSACARSMTARRPVSMDIGPTARGENRPDGSAILPAPPGHADLCVDRSHVPLLQVARRWGYYVVSGSRARLRERHGDLCAGKAELTHARIWIPLPWFDTVKHDAESQRPDSDQLLCEAKGGTLPAVSWVMPSGASTASIRRPR